MLFTLLHMYINLTTWGLNLKTQQMLAENLLLIIVQDNFNGMSVSRDVEALVVTVEEKQDAHKNNENRTNEKITIDNSIK